MKPRVVIFCCSWATYPGFQLSELQEGKTDSEYRVVITMCSGRVSPELIIESFNNGAWGVMIAGCPVGECEHDGNYKTKSNYHRSH